MPRIFVGSSSAAKSQAKAVIRALALPTITFVPWWESFRAGNTLLDELDNIRGNVDAALLIFSPEASSTVRRRRVQVPNLNVLFEFGYFYGCFGRTRVAMLKYGEFYLPSDLGGYIHISGSTFFRRSAVVKVGKRTEDEFMRWARGL